jgi:hypothetical protein
VRIFHKVGSAPKRTLTLGHLQAQFLAAAHILGDVAKLRIGDALGLLHECETDTAQYQCTGGQ